MKNKTAHGGGQHTADRTRSLLRVPMKAVWLCLLLTMLAPVGLIAPHVRADVDDTSNAGQHVAQGVPVAWGSDSSGQLGNGSYGGNAYSPTVVSNLAVGGIVAVATGCAHSLAVTTKGTVYAWGSATNGQLGNGESYGQQSSPVTVTSPSGTGALSGTVAVAAGCSHSLALTSQGTVYAWGDNRDGELGNGTNSNASIPVSVTGLTGVVAIAAGDSHSLALLSNGTIMAWGYNGDGELGNDTTINSTTPVLVKGFTGATHIAAGGYHSLAVRTGGTVWAWGSNNYNQLGNTGASASIPELVNGIGSAVAVAGGGSHSLVIKSDGTVWGWGANFSGQLGNGSQTGGAVPVQTIGITNAVSIAAGAAHSLARTADHRLWGWGDGSYGQVDNCGTSYCATPIQATINPVLIVGTGPGAQHSLAVVGPTVTITPGSVSFGVQTVGTGSKEQFVTAQATNYVPITISSVKISGANVNDFKISFDDCAGQTVAVNTSCTVGLKFVPKATGARSATLVITDQAYPSATQSVVLTGTGS